MINKGLFCKEILNENLTRPNWTKQDHRLARKLWLDKNECLDPEMIKIVSQSLSGISPETVFSYPELDVLYNKIARFCGVSSDNILITQGSDAAIRACFESCIEPRDKIVLTRPTFAMYDIYSKIFGANVVWLDYDASPSGPVLEVERIVSIIKTTVPKMVCLPNPDSPTGTIFSPDNLRRIIDTASDVGSLMLLDEAYHPIYHWSAVPWINEYKNLVVVRSFSKAWAAAGLRVGYALANHELIEFLHKQRPMYEIGNVSAKAIEILLDHEKDMELSVARVNAGKKYFQDTIREIGLSTFESHGNFFHVNFGIYSDQIHNALDDKVYYRKAFNVPCLSGYSRFSATTKEMFEPIISCIIDIVNKKRSPKSENV